MAVSGGKSTNVEFSIYLEECSDNFSTAETSENLTATQYR